MSRIFARSRRASFRDAREAATCSRTVVEDPRVLDGRDATRPVAASFPLRLLVQRFATEQRLPRVDVWLTLLQGCHPGVQLSLGFLKLLQAIVVRLELSVQAIPQLVDGVAPRILHAPT